jgi:hypothetical protein
MVNISSVCAGNLKCVNMCKNGRALGIIQYRCKPFDFFNSSYGMMQPVFTEASESLQGLIPRLLEEVALRQVERELTDVRVITSE